MNIATKINLHRLSSPIKSAIGLTRTSKFFLTEITSQLNFTPSFYEAIQNKLDSKKDGSFLRLEILAGEGCEGFTYKFKFDSEINKQKDYVKSQTFINKQGKQSERVLFAVNEEQVKLLRGSTIDFVQEMMREVFQVKENPNAEIECSCKVSFSPKEGLL